MTQGDRLLTPELLARLSRLRLSARQRVEGRYAGAHASRRYGSSIDFADYREYVPGDDPRTIDPHAHARLGRLLVRLFEAEDEAALRVVVDCSASMRFGGKLARAREIAAGLAAVAAGGGDRVRVLLARGYCDAGPWFRGIGSLPGVEARLVAATASGIGDLRAALGRAHAEGPRGPVVLVSDLLVEEYQDVLRALATGRGDGVVVHVLGRADLDPDLEGDVRLVDSETGREVEIGLADEVRARYRSAVTSWLDDIAATCARHRIAYTRVMDDGPVDELFSVTLTGLGVLA